MHIWAPLRIGNRGILHRDLGWGWIPWDEIEGAYPPAAGDGKTLRLRLRVTQRLAGVLAAQAPALVAGDEIPRSVEISLDLAGSALHPADLLLEILAHGAGAGRGP